MSSIRTGEIHNMCGIVGVLSNNPNEDVNLESAVQLLRHRGPDDSGVWGDWYIHLGHTRLSILDLSPIGHQPMSYQNDRFWITFNGEIYNYIELRQELMNVGHRFASQTDTEVVLAAYSQWGQTCLRRLRGMFAFGIWDKIKETLFLARDRIGEKPLYYLYDDRVFYFASELKSLLSLLPQQPSLNPAAIDLYLYYQYVPEPLTPLNGVVKLPAAHSLKIRAKNWQFVIQRYWDIEDIEPVEGKPQVLIRQELEKSIELTLRSDVPIGVALSGGIDSSAITALAAAKYKETLQTFSIGYPGRPPYDERRYAQKLAQKLKLPYHEVELTTEALVEFFPSLVCKIDEPIADIAAYSHYSVMNLAAEHGIRVMLTGIGGDELFWGYPWVLEALKLTGYKQQILQKYSSIPQMLWQILTHLVTHPFYQSIAQNRKLPQPLQTWLLRGLAIHHLSLNYPQQAVYLDRFSSNFQEMLAHQNRLYTKKFRKQIPTRNAYQCFELSLREVDDIPEHIYRILFETWLVSNCLSLGDRVSMASSVEVRLPLLDYKLIELVIGLQKAQSEEGIVGDKFWLKAALSDLLSEDILHRPKRGFQPPVQEWIKAIIMHYMHWLREGFLVELSILNASYLQILLQEFADKHRHIFLLYKLLLLEIWYRKVIMRH